MSSRNLSRRDALAMGSAALLGAAFHGPTVNTQPTTPTPEPGPMSDADDLCFMTAIELAQRIGRKDVSAREVMEAHLRQIERVNPKVNAIITLLPERAMAGARAADEQLARGGPIGPLHGLPTAHKDLQDTRGIRTTYGSPIYKDHVPTEDALLVERVRQAGAIAIGKTNTPEFGAGSQTFNPVFGATRNPWDLSKTCGGSSGGAAVSLACGMLPIADGSDMGGSLRNPAGWCNVVGFRPSPGRVPDYPESLGWFTLSTDGPMARTVSDVALFLSVLAGPDPRCPINLEEPGSRFAQPLGRDLKGVRVAWVKDLGLPFDPRVKAAVDAQRRTFEAMGCIVEDAEPDFADADEAFKLWRAWSFATGMADDYQKHRDLMKDTVIWNIEQGLKLTGLDLGRVEGKRTALWRRVQHFMERYEFMVLPVSQVPPFDVTRPYPTEINGVAMTTYIDWMKSCYFISAIGNPAISVPAGFTAEGLPVGLQIVGRHRDDWAVLQAGYAYEQATGIGKRRPPVVSGS